jgi:beta-N-acetylhexosaminidase
MTASALIVGCRGLVFTPEEKTFFRRFDPWGLILFQRNCQSPEQIKALVASFRILNGRSDAPVLIDQEGGRVQRLKPPLWRQYPPARIFGDIYQNDRDAAQEAVYLITRLIAEDLHALGITVDCLPVLDLPQPDADRIIGDRAYGSEREVVATLAAKAATGLMHGGVLPVIKHVPGHGRATADSHLELPVITTDADILRETDFAPFKDLSDLPLAMTAHVIYEAFDSDQPATLSPTIVNDVIRGHMGFDGLIMSDDLSMKALSASFEQRTAKAFTAGCDVVLHCNGDMAEMEAIALNTPRLESKSLKRAQAALTCLNYPQNFDRDRALSLLSRLVPNSL